MKDYQITWEGVIHDSTGYSKVARETVLALSRAGVDVRIQPMDLGTSPVGLPIGTLEELQKLIAKPIAKNKSKVLIFHHPPSMCDVDKARREYDRILLNTYWETTKLPKTWGKLPDLFDHLICATRWIEEVFRANGVRAPATVAPFGMPTPPEQSYKLDLGPDRRMYAFLSVGTWQHRKGFDLLLRAFWDEFKASEDVCLVIKTGVGPSLDLQRRVRLAVRRFREQHGVGGPPVLLNVQDVIEDQMTALFNTCDSFVLPSRGEGVGLPYLEAIAAGKPVIATGWGGQEDFLNRQNSYVVDYRLKPCPVKYLPDNGLAAHPADLYEAGMVWAEPDMCALRNQMRDAFEQRTGEAKAKAESAKLSTSWMTWDHSASLVRRAVESTL